MTGSMLRISRVNLLLEFAKCARGGAEMATGGAVVLDGETGTELT
jgi:hypothetical protein